MTIIEKYKENSFVLPAVVDYIDFQDHAAIDIIQHKDQVFKKDQELEYNGQQFRIHKKVKDYPVQTSANMQDRTDFRKVRYFCNKINHHE